MLGLLALGNREPALLLTPPVSWLLLGRNKFAATAFVAAMVLTTPLLKLPHRRDRIAVGLLMLCVVVHDFRLALPRAGFQPRYRLAALKTRMDRRWRLPAKHRLHLRSRRPP